MVPLTREQAEALQALAALGATSSDTAKLTDAPGMPSRNHISRLRGFRLTATRVERPRARGQQSFHWVTAEGLERLEAEKAST